MNILIVHLAKLESYPPVINLIYNLLDQMYNVEIITYKDKVADEFSHNRVKVTILQDIPTNSFITTSFHFVKRRKKLKELILDSDRVFDVIWTTNDYAVRDIGKILFNFKHVMQLMELCEDIPCVPMQKVFKTHLNKYARKAFKVVVPEENRAYILKAWWNLDKKPEVLPNKPYQLSLGKLSDKQTELLHNMKNDKRTKIIYQGVFSADRSLEEFAEAISKLGIEKYAFYIMGEDSELRKQLCEKYTFIQYLGFIAPPNHLHYTKEADIGILPYIPSSACYHYSVLNALYCAPNKIYEYSAMGLPMIGTDVAGLKTVFSNYHIGVCCKELRSKEIIEAIKEVESNYLELKSQCKIFYDATDLKRIVKNILES